MCMNRSRAPVLGIPRASIVFHHPCVSNRPLAVAAPCIEVSSCSLGVARSTTWFGKTGRLSGLVDELAGRSNSRADLVVETGSNAILMAGDDDLAVFSKSWMTSDLQFPSTTIHLMADLGLLRELYIALIDGSLDGLVNISISAMATTRSFFPSLIATYWAVRELVSLEQILTLSVLLPLACKL